MGSNDQYAFPPQEERAGMQALPDPPAPARVATRTGSRWQSTPSTLDPQLVGRLFAAPERWGWEYLEPIPLQPYPHLADYPRWVEPPEPDLSGLYAAARAAKAKLPSRLGWGIPLAQVGRTVTDGGSASTGGQRGYSTSEGSTGDAWGWATGTSSTFSENWSKSWQDAKNWSQAQSESDSTTLQRSYEFTVEPTVVQSLEPTAFILVDSRADGRRVVAGDCFPGMVLVDRVSSTPR